MKTSELTGRAFDWAVAQSGNDGTLGFWSDPDWSPSTKWEHGGPIIEREGISVETTTMRGQGGNFSWLATRFEGPAVSEEYGLTPLIAAMRCYVASKLGDKVDVPEGLQ